MSIRTIRGSAPVYIIGLIGQEKKSCLCVVLLNKKRDLSVEVGQSSGHELNHDLSSR